MPVPLPITIYRGPKMPRRVTAKWLRDNAEYFDTEDAEEIARLGFLERCQHRTPLDGGFWYGYCGQVHERPAERAPDGTWSCGHHLRFHLDPPGAGAPHVSPSQEDPASDLPRQASGDARPHGGDAPRGGGEDRPPG